jgi:hypothetical protein
VTRGLCVSTAQRRAANLRNPDHLFDFAMVDSAANVVAAHVSLFPERIEGADELRIFP